MGLRELLDGLLGSPPKCRDRETLIQPGGWVDNECTLSPGHDGNHYDRDTNLEWGDGRIHDHGERHTHFGQ